MKKLILILCFFLITGTGFGEILRDPISGKILVYNQNGEDAWYTSLNPMEEITLWYSEFEGTLGKDKLKVYLKGLLKDPSFLSRFQEQKKRAIDNFIMLNYGKELSPQEVNMLQSQTNMLKEVAIAPAYLFNGVICFRIKAKFYINSQYRDIKHEELMYSSVFMDAQTGKISTFEELVPAEMRNTLVAELTEARNKKIREAGLNSNRRALWLLSEDDQIDVAKLDTVRPDKFLENITLGELHFDVFSRSIVVGSNGANTQYTFGAGYNFPMPESLIARCLPFAKPFPEDNQLKPEVSQATNTSILAITVSPINYFHDSYLRKEFQANNTKGSVTIYQRQLRSRDSIFKPAYQLFWNAGNRLDSLVHMKDPGSRFGEKVVYAFWYDSNGRLIRFRNEEKTQFQYSYNKAGFLTEINTQPFIFRKWYLYRGTSLLEFTDRTGQIEHHTFEFDSEGNLLCSLGFIAKDTCQKSVFSGRRLLADAKRNDHCSYLEDNRIDSKETDNGTWFTKYLYNNAKKISQIKKYQDDELIETIKISYDPKGRMMLIRKTGYSNGYVSYDVEQKMEYSK